VSRSKQKQLNHRPINISNSELVYLFKEPKETIIDTTEYADLYEVNNIGKVDRIKWCNNLFFGDNLSILKTLYCDKEIKGNVKLIYIDPPFSTNHQFRSGESRTSTISPSGKDIIAYEDKLTGVDYLEFLRKRLFFLRKLLANDGSIYVHIDWKMGHYVKVLMDEIFGEKHFINDIARIKCNPKNFPRAAYGNVKDIIFFYSKTSEYVWNNSKEDYNVEEIKKLFPKINEKGRRYATNPLHAPGETKNGATGQPWKGIKPPRGRHWRYPPDELTRLDEVGLIEWSNSGNPRKIIYADEFVKKKKKRQDIWEFKDPTYPSYPTEKNLEMLKTIIKASSNKGDLVLDCFCGSGTTLVASEQLGRRWIGIDNSELAIDTAQKRLSGIIHTPFITYTTNSQSNKLSK
jgi:adenine-specific DNA-methyltransferase